MTNPQYTLLISSCEHYKDLWEANITLLQKNWPNRECPVFLVTDAPASQKISNVQVIAAGEGLEITDRLRTVLQQVHTPYVILTLEDYFFTEPIETQKLQQALTFLEETGADYLQLYPQPKVVLKRAGAREARGYPGIYFVDTSCGNYKVALTPGIWRKAFLEKTLVRSLNAWQYEVSLTETARKVGARCATSNRGELPYLDVIRKGKVLRKAHRYFRTHPVYSSQRVVMTRRETCYLWLRHKLKVWLPGWLLRLLKIWMIRRGMTFYSPIS